MERPVPTLRVGSQPCACDAPRDDPKLVVVTGGPGAGKTAVLELASRTFCRHVAILPETATIIFGGGFPRHDTAVGLRAVQSAIFAVQRQLEALVLGEGRVAVALCDRGTIDGIGYWPGPPESFWEAVGTTQEEEMGRYAAVIHLQVPPIEEGYHTDALRIESAERAAAVDRLIAAGWSGHPNRIDVPAFEDFARKARVALDAIRDTLPECCRQRLVDRAG